MYITKKIAQKKTRVHSDDSVIDDPTGEQPWLDVKAYIQKGEVYYQISNGTIGKGCSYKNYSQQAIMNLINSEAGTWVKGHGWCNKDKLAKIKSIKVKRPKKEKIISKESIDYNFTLDDIPF